MTHSSRKKITLSNETIHNPDEPRHFMRIKPITAQVRILRERRLLAESRRALRLIEAGRDIYDPTIYLPRGDVAAPLGRSDKRTFCPLKGHASYFDLLNEAGEVDVAEIAWSYEETEDFADELKALIAFYPSKVTIEEVPGH